MATPIRSVPAPIEVAEVVAFEEFFDAERTRLFGALAAMSGNRAEAEEVMQDAFLRVWERRDQVAVMDPPDGFLYRTAMNVLVPVALVISGGRSHPTPSSVAGSTGSSQPTVQGIVGLPPEGATPSSSARGQQVLHFWFGHTPGDAGRFSLYAYADGRRARRPPGLPRAAARSPVGYLEQRLTSEGVDLVLAEVLSTGLLDHDRALEGSLGLNYGGIALRSGGQLVQLVWGGTDFEEGTKPAAHAPTLDEVRAIEAIDTRLEDLTSWLPGERVGRPEVKAFVASRFSACYLYTGPTTRSEGSASWICSRRRPET